jgi:hypothetical protein
MSIWEWLLLQLVGRYIECAVIFRLHLEQRFSLYIAQISKELREKTVTAIQSSRGGLFAHWWFRRGAL